MFSTKTIAFILAAASAVVALPTATVAGRHDYPTETVQLTGTTKQVAVGRGGVLDYQPFNLFAEVGDIVEFQFGPMNHSVVQSTFDNPCVQSEGGFNSGFNFAVAEGVSDQVFQLTNTDASVPIWFFCGQGNHCNSGMVGSINQKVDSGNTFDAFKALATKPGVVTVLGDVSNGSGAAVGSGPLPNTRLNDGF